MKSRKILKGIALTVVVSFLVIAANAFAQARRVEVKRPPVEKEPGRVETVPPRPLDIKQPAKQFGERPMLPISEEPGVVNTKQGAYPIWCAGPAFREKGDILQQIKGLKTAEEQQLYAAALLEPLTKDADSIGAFEQSFAKIDELVKAGKLSGNASLALKQLAKSGLFVRAEYLERLGTDAEMTKIVVDAYKDVQKVSLAMRLSGRTVSIDANGKVSWVADEKDAKVVKLAKLLQKYGLDIGVAISEKGKMTKVVDPRILAARTAMQLTNEEGMGYERLLDRVVQVTEEYGKGLKDGQKMDSNELAKRIAVVLKDELLGKDWKEFATQCGPYLSLPQSVWQALAALAKAA